MSLLPRLLGSAYWDSFPDYPEHLFDQHFGSGIHDHDMIHYSGGLSNGSGSGQIPVYWIFPRSASVPRSAGGNSRGNGSAVKNGPARKEMERRALASGASQVANNPNEFLVKLDVRHFKPEEVEVTVQGNNLIVHGRHEERSDEHGFISREFTRRYALPENVVQDQLSSSLEQNGILAIKAPKKLPEQKAGEVRTIPIQFVGGAGGPQIGPGPGPSNGSAAEAPAQDGGDENKSA